MRLNKVIVTGILAISAGLLLPAAAQADDDEKRKVARGAFALGFPSENDFVGGDFGTQYGISGALGYQFSPAFSADVEFTWTGGGDVSGLLPFQTNSSSWALVWNGRLYPIALLGGNSDGPIRPYVITGFGAGSAKVESPEFDSAAFVINLGAGADLMLSDTWGLYAEVAHKFHTGNVKIVNGITNLNFGAVFKF